MALRSTKSRRSDSDAGNSSSYALWAVVGLTVAIVGGGALIYQKAIKSKVTLDSSTLCPEPTKLTEITVVLLDVSDVLTPAQH
jgi:hypothetical protein